MAQAVCGAEGGTCQGNGHGDGYAHVCDIKIERGGSHPGRHHCGVCGDMFN
jgi:hypothetical protein